MKPYRRRSHALYDARELVAVMAYKPGAVEVKRLFEALEQEIVRLKQAVRGPWNGSRPSVKLRMCARAKRKRNDRRRSPEYLGDTQPGSHFTPS